MPRGNRNLIEREREILELRKSGASWAAIGKHFGISASRACVIGNRAIQRIPSTVAADLRRIECERLDQMQGAVWRKAVVDGNLQCIDRVLKIMERRSKLLGLDLPTRIEVNHRTVEEAADVLTSQLAAFQAGIAAQEQVQAEPPSSNGHTP